MAKRSFSLAFATTNAAEDCRVWWWTLLENFAGNDADVAEGEILDDMINFLWDNPDINKVYVHGLKYYSYFLMSCLFQNGFRHVKTSAEAEDCTFTTMIISGGKMYSLDIYFEVKNGKNNRKVHKVSFKDTGHIVNLYPWEICNNYNLKPVPVMEFMTGYREIDYRPSLEERQELIIRCKMCEKILEDYKKSGLKGNTLAASSIRNYRNVHQRKFNDFFPLIDPEIDKDIRPAYFGGYNYLYPSYVDREVQNGTVIDVNSMYPFVLSSMSNFKIPIGQAIHYNGRYKKNDTCDLFIQKFTCAFRLKKNGVPIIRFRDKSGFDPSEYLLDSKGDIYALTLSSPDLKLFFENYDVYFLKWIDGYMFRSRAGLFDGYIYEWMSKKREAKKTKNKVLSFLSKGALNTIGGKFGSLNSSKLLNPYLDDDGCIEFEESYGDIPDPVYLPVALFMTAYARLILIRTSRKLSAWGIKNKGFDPVIYHDTDSIHVLSSAEELRSIPFLKIDDYDLGAWKIEAEFKRGRYLFQKCYCLDLGNDILKIAASGLPSGILPYVKYENFTKGFSTVDIEDRLKRPLYRSVPGGCVIDHTDYTI